MSRLEGARLPAVAVLRPSCLSHPQDLGTPSEKIWPGYNDLPAVKKMTFTEYPYNNLRKRFGALLSDQGFDLMNKCVNLWPPPRAPSRPCAGCQLLLFPQVPDLLPWAESQCRGRPQA